jgi:hypothetical protein
MSSTMTILSLHKPEQPMGSSKNMFAEFAQPRRDRFWLVLARFRVGMPLQHRHWFATVTVIAR